MQVRKLTLNDLEMLISLRLDFFNIENVILQDAERSMIKNQLKEYFFIHIPDNSFVAYVAESDSKAASVGFMVIQELPASPFFLSGKTGTILNVFTYPEHRHKGYATEVMKNLLEYAKQNNISSVQLNATEEGKGLYEKLGFKPMKYTAMNIPL